MKGKPWQDWVILAVSGWLFFSPFALGYATLSHPAAWVAYISSLALFISASEALVVPDAIEEWLDGGVGIAMIASPWLMGFGADVVAAWNTVIAGIVVMVFATMALVRDLQTAPTGHHFARG